MALSIVVTAVAGTPDEAAVAAEIRALLLRFHPRQAATIARLALEDSERREAEIRRIDPHARWLRDQADAPPVAGGIGADLFRRDGGWWLAPWRDGALYQRGIQRRARLLAVDDKPPDEERQVLAARLRGEPGSLVCVDLRIDGETREVCLVRRVLRQPSVEILGAERLRIRRFRAHETRILLQQAIETLIAGGARRLRIDLRESPGGDLYEALDSAALFLPTDTPLVILQRLDDGGQRVRAPAALPEYALPLTLIVGADTASAAEIFAGILQRAGRARLLGGPTHGKCSSQTRFRLSDGSRLWLTNLLVRFTDGSTCEGRGLMISRQLPGSD